MEALKSHIQDILEISINSTTPLTGGDISTVTKIDTSRGSFVLKSGIENDLQLFRAEAAGLDLIRTTKTIATPMVIEVGIENGTTFLLMEYISSKSPNEEDYSNLGNQLAKLHEHSGNTFGLSYDNFIGSLPQKNSISQNWIDFYSKHRLGFQLDMAIKKNLLNSLEVPSIESISSVLKVFCPNIQPSLLHGDLWSGNYLIAEDGTPYLIDPAVYFGHSEMDIAMSKLFGGFGRPFYEAYYSQKPKTDYFDECIELYQLYYLLVHLNLFGRSYYSSVKRILESFF